MRLTQSEIKALVVACRELAEKIPFVVSDYYEDFNLGFKSNDEINDALHKVTEKLESSVK